MLDGGEIGDRAAQTDKLTYTKTGRSERVYYIVDRQV